jgi:hypothetical protein
MAHPSLFDFSAVHRKAVLHGQRMHVRADLINRKQVARRAIPFIPTSLSSRVEAEQERRKCSVMSQPLITIDAALHALASATTPDELIKLSNQAAA